MSDREQDNDVVDPLGRPKLHPTDPANDPDAPDPGKLVPGRPGAPSDVPNTDTDPAGDVRDE